MQHANSWSEVRPPSTFSKLCKLAVLTIDMELLKCDCFHLKHNCCRDAILHVCRIHRVLMQPRGNALLVGVGGSGRKSLSRLATYVADQKCFSIEISKGYRSTEFREDLKTLYRQVLKAIPAT